MTLDRLLDDLHHYPTNCILISTHLNDTKSAHYAFKTREALTQHCRETKIDESASNHAMMCAVFWPIIEGMIRRWLEKKAVM